MSDDPWSWLLGRTAAGLWRHVPYQATEPGQGQDPRQEPRVEVIQQLIAYPPEPFAAAVAGVRALDGPERPVRWLCYRQPGDRPARGYWLCFVTARPGGRRFHVGLELYDRERLGLWFFSGYDPAAVAPELLAPLPGRPDVMLPRVELTAAGLAAVPLARWLREAWEDRLSFARAAAAAGAGASSRPTGAALAGELPPSADRSGVLDASLVDLDAGDMALELRAARARLLVCPPGGGAPLHVPLGRLTTVIGRDPRCDLVLDDRSVSSEHARITWREGLPGIEDLGSKNGTSVAGQPLGPRGACQLPAEARIDLGAVSCLFVRDIEDTLLPGSPAPGVRQEQRLQALVAGGELKPDEAEQARADAALRGLTPGEVLVSSGRLTLERWAPAPAAGGCGGTAALLLLGALLLLLTGCHSLAFPPFYEQELDGPPAREGSREVEWDFDLGLRPFFQARHDAEGGRTEGHLLFPLGYMEKGPEGQKFRVYPLYQRIVRTDPDGFPDDDTIIFPFVWTGSHPVEGDYLYVFPFGGRLRGLLGKDEAIGVLFPLYGWARRGETESHHVLFPLISWTSGGGQRGFRVLPFYGHHEKERDGVTIYSRTTVLWPFLHWSHGATNSRNPYEAFFFFPFYGRIRSDWMDDDTVLWPFFRWFENKQTGYSEWRVPFPFLIYGQGPDHTRLDVWPLFGFRHRGDYRRHFFLFPLERYEVQETEEYVDQRFWLLPLFWSKHRAYRDGSGTDLKLTVWPLLRYEDRRDGKFEVKALAPLWFDDPLLNFETILDPLWRVFRYARDPEGRTELDLLLGLYSARSAPSGESRWDVLGGLVGHSSGPAGGKLRLLWFLEL